MMKQATTTAVCLMMLAVAACNTVEGLGRDLQSAGNAISRAADEASN